MGASERVRPFLLQENYVGNAIIPNKLLVLFDECIRKDQGGTYRAYLRKVLPHIEDAYRETEEGFRSHLGASISGQECGRSIWYSFRWATRSNFSAQMLRLFNRGHLEEGRFIALMLAAGLQVFQQDGNGHQFRISHSFGHVGGSGDGVIVGIPDVAPGTPALGEFKTHNLKSFESLAGDNWRAYCEALITPGAKPVPFTGKGVRESKFEHYVQLQIYMSKMGLAVCLYVAVNKNTDEIYCELVPLNTPLAEQFLDRSDKIVWMEKPPNRINESPGFFKCRYCDHRPVCHLDAAPERNCRTCAFSEPLPQEHAKWRCRLKEMEIGKALQLTGCEQYVVRKTM